MKMLITRNQWESDFFGRDIGKVEFTNECQLLLNDTEAFQLLQGKVASDQHEQMAFLQQQGFQFVEGEIDFCLPLASLPLTKNAEDSTACFQATERDLPELVALFGCAFPTSRFRLPWFSMAENQVFYQTWITKAVRGEFDDICLILKEKEVIQGGISLRQVQQNVRVGLLAVAPSFQGQGIAQKLLQAAIVWAKQRNAQNMYIATQFSNLPAINLYQKLGARSVSTHYWFYKQR